MKFLSWLICLLFSLSLSAQQVKEDTAITDVVERVEHITKMLNRVNNTLRRGFDTTEIAEKLPGSEKLVNDLRNSVLNDRRLMNIRSLYALQVILREMEEQHAGWQRSLSTYSRTITDMSGKIDNILRDTLLRQLPKDPSLQGLYTYQLSRLDQKWQQADTANRNSLQRIGVLQNRVAMNYITITDMLDEVEFRLKNAEKRIWTREEKNLWDVRLADYRFPFHDTFYISFVAAHRVWDYYFRYNRDIHLLNLILFFVFLFWLLNSISRIRKNHPDATGIFANTKYASHKPLLTSLIFIFTLGPFFYTNPPIVHMELFWLVQTACVTWVLKDESPVWLRWQWFLLLFLYTAYALFNLMMQSSFEERWAQFFLQLGTLATVGWFLRKQRKSTFAFPPYTRIIVWLTLLMTVTAFVCNLTGRVMLSKFLGMSAVFSLISAQALLILMELLLETFYLHIEANKANSRFAAYLDFNRIKKGLRSTLFLLVGIGWLAILIRNLNIHNIIRDTVFSFLRAERTIGNTSFTFSSVFIFLVVIWVAFLISKVMVFIFGHQEAGGVVKKYRWSSAVLLIRLAVLAAGLLLAFAASGIPIDKLTIIIGALSVGIGFGLQNIVNNLVSGVILAFEKPVEIGDVIDIGTQHGTVKEIGIRASKIATVDGSEIIVPNGDLLSQHITNWTLTNRSRRVELIIGVAYGSDLKKASELLKELLLKEEGVQSVPVPLVLVHELNDSSIDFRILFWADIGTWVILKSSLLLAIYTAFSEQGIEIPFPQSDIHIKNPPSN
ncbi:mechanosensitive ion channel [Chitinophaga sp. SYP-B3965]|uniref:mechanosensitive ion channel family protein n=1 Tax=Chitinophaga sp. SYP-B3965 TaxID=2663120 RepID=UPI001299555A|nr:mechanosensitive ion channel domain-containing protein [Chitinophaga sp. SYP-B3965]MRG46330.1 mechanosensitive ion channel [Chitinophaga sp. SYP-B3965]